MKKINKDQKVTLTFGQLKRLVKEATENELALIDINGTSDSKFIYRNKPCELITTSDAKEELEKELEKYPNEEENKEKTEEEVEELIGDKTESNQIDNTYSNVVSINSTRKRILKPNKKKDND